MIDYLIIGSPIILYITIVVIIIKVLKQRDQKLKLEAYEIDLKYGPILNIEAQLDFLIESVFNEYKIYNLEYKDDAYVKELEEQQIVRDLCDIVLDRISPAFVTQLSTYFNIEKLGSIIASKISMRVMEYRILRNTN